MQTMELDKVGDLAAGMPNATRVFEEFGIDYCCGGQRTLAEACAAAGRPLQDVLTALQERQEATSVQTVNWQTRSVTELTHYILDRFHAQLKKELPALAELSLKVLGAHGATHHELRELRDLYLALKDDLEQHMMKEERILFPAIFAMEEGTTERAGGCFGSIENPIRVMMMEHDNAGTLLKKMRETSRNYAVPADGCASFRTLYDRLSALERELHEHIHLENNILFPRAIELQAS